MSKKICTFAPVCNQKGNQSKTEENMQNSYEKQSGATVVQELTQEWDKRADFFTANMK